ncbi:uncharacterized protein L3040_005791 [Drepanopeziza brunnea f. sp. 'multigermtubi']|nr:hypothetical protein L3040_005791 [Drepanopeziza brunnea f. sp. 'multigermtubi']
MVAIHSTRRITLLAIVALGLVWSTLLFRYKPSLSSLPALPQKVQDHIDYFRAPKSPEYSIKPLVYIFPQYYHFDENNEIWGVNFTEWDNVREVTYNAYGIETIRPHESVGYYDGLAFETRERQGRFLRDHGFYGAIFHHYWFAGVPVMDGILQAMLKDGEPNVPFMLSWANEPWTKTWDGVDSSETFIAQEYGDIRDWREHFDWLLPFFRHPKYIRSQGRIQMAVYKPSHMGPRRSLMFAAWRQWAIEEGLGGLDVVETRWAGTGDCDASLPDAINEFQPHIGGFDHFRHSMARRNARVYHRGTLVCWDSTPRHSTDGGGNPQSFCHPKSWQYYMVEMYRKIKEDPNPIGAENFVFINALNEWGEGNALEPSVQFNDGYGVAMKEAIRISEELHNWTNTRFEGGLERSPKPKQNRTLSIGTLKKPKEAKVKEEEEDDGPIEEVDICVLIKTSEDNRDDRTYKLSAMLDSLQAQKNPSWRAVIYEPLPAMFHDLEDMVYRAFDPRIEMLRIPEEELVTRDADEESKNEEESKKDEESKNDEESKTDEESKKDEEIKKQIEENKKNEEKAKQDREDQIALQLRRELDAGSKVTDWVINKLAKDSKSVCGAAKYLLITTGYNIYHPDAFDAVIKSDANLIGLNVESRRTLWNSYETGPTTWQDRCSRPAEKTASLCKPATMTPAYFDLAATFIDFPRFVKDGYQFSSYTETNPRHQDWALISHLARDKGWSFASSSGSSTCHLKSNPAYSTCTQTGNIYVDSPMFEETGCFTPTAIMMGLGSTHEKMGILDMEYYRAHAFCLRYRSKTFRTMWTMDVKERLGVAQRSSLPGDLQPDETTEKTLSGVDDDE